MNSDNNLHYVYIVKCRDNTLYTGYTIDINKRINTHNKRNGSKYCKIRLPVKLVYKEVFLTKSSACSREYRIKQLKKKDKLKLINKNKINIDF